MKIHSKLTNHRLFLALTMAAIVFIFGIGSYFIKINNNVGAASITNFKAGNIISDYVFYNKSSMSVAQIQEFLNRQIGSCDTWGSQRATDWGRGDITRAQFAKQKWGVNPPFVCLNNYHENPNTNETSYEKGGGWFQGGVSAAQIIYDAAQKYGINPQVLLVMLKKESSGPLTSDKWPLKNQYRYAMGYACPDSGPNNSANCNAKQAGFYKQVNLAAWQLKYYRDHPNDYRYKLGWNDIQYSPNIACGTKRVYIENVATLSLYIYTPYTPNDAALANYPGTAHCGAYGNRNFFMFFSEWFGNTQHAGFIPLNTPRYMEISGTNTSKVNVYDGTSASSIINKGRHIKFVDKIFIDGVWYLRSEFDKNTNTFTGIPQDQISDISYEKIDHKWLTLTSDGNKSIPNTRTSTGEKLIRGTSVKIVDKITIDGNIYYRTEYDNKMHINSGIHSRFLSDFQPIQLEHPRNFCSLDKNVNKINPQESTIFETVPQKAFSVNNKVLIAGTWYFQAKDDAGTLKYINSNHITDACYIPFEQPRKMILNKNAQKINPHTGHSLGSFSKNTEMFLSEKIFINNQWYYRTSYDSGLNLNSAITASSFKEI